MMTTREARRLLVGTVIMWDNDPDNLGTVRNLSQTSFYVDWENGQQGWIDYRDAARVSIR